MEPYLASQLQASAAGCASQLAYSTLRVIVPQEPNHPLLITNTTPGQKTTKNEIVPFHGDTTQQISSPLRVNSTMGASLSTPDIKSSLMSPDLNTLTRPMKGRHNMRTSLVSCLCEL